jgi:hypothetical protein
MPAQAPGAPAVPRAPILTPSEALARRGLLTELQAALTVLGVQCVLARRHRLVLRYADGPVSPSGPTDPTLHVFAPCGTFTVSTNGATYRLRTGQELPADDAAAAASALIGLQHPPARPSRTLQHL